jgi:four helix bundle protein
LEEKYGFGEGGYYTNPDFIRFLYMSRGSCAELRTQLELLKSYTKEEKFPQIDKIILESQEVSKMIYGLIKSLKTQPNS